MAYRSEQSWTEEELHILRSKYPTHGPGRVAKMLGRSVQSCKTKAMQENIRVGDIPGWVSCAAIAAATGLHINTVRDRAELAGVSRRITSASGNKVVARLVPEAWADAYVKAVLRGREAEELAGHYYDLEKVAKIFGVHHATVRRWLYGSFPDSYGARMMNRIRFLVTSGVDKRRYLFDPYHVEAEARKYREYLRTQEEQRQNRRRKLRPE